MTGQRAVAGLSLLCALVFCAVAAPSAMAATSGFDYYTCIKVTPLGTGEYKNGHCSVKDSLKKSNFGHLVFLKSTNVTFINKTTKNPTTEEEGVEESTLITLSGESGGVKLELTATGFVSSESSFVETTETEAMKALGGGEGTYTGVKILKPEKCVIAKEEIKQFNSVSEVFENASKVLEVNFKPKAPPNFAEFEIINKGEEKCPLNKVVIKVSGEANGIPEGAFVKFTEASTKGTKCGEAGTKGLCIGPKPAFFTGSFTLRNKTKGVEGNPIVTTKTP